MRSLQRRDIPAGAAITIAALVLLASAVTGREEDRPPAAPVEPVPAAAPKQSATADDLDVEQLKRPRKEGVPPNLFTPRLPQAPRRAAGCGGRRETRLRHRRPPPRRCPSGTLGRMVDNGKAVVFLERGQESLVAAAGETIEGTYQVESIGESAVQFVYLPLAKSRR